MLALGPAHAQTEQPVFEYKLTDAAGDQQAHCTTGLTPNPCDITAFEATSTGEEFVFRFTTATLTFAAPATPSSVHFRFIFKDPAGTSYNAQRSVTATGQGAASFSGDAAQPSGITWELDRPAAQFTGRFPLDGLEDVEPGATIAITTIQTYFTHAGVLFWTNMDNIASPPPYEFPASAVPDNLTVEAPDDLVMAPGESRESTITVFNHDAQEANVTLTITDASMPTVLVELPSNTTSIPAGGNATFNITIVVPADTPDGPASWLVVATGERGGNATATLAILIKAPATSETAENSGATNDSATSAASEAGAPAAEEGGIPGFEAVALAIGLALAALGLRRRRA